MSVVNSVLLYGCEVWAVALQKEKYRKPMGAVQRRGALRIASAYRTVSEPAVLVIAGVMPIDIMAMARMQVYNTASERGYLEARSLAQEDAMSRWHERWRMESRGRWTARLIWDLSGWVDRGHGEVDYFITQFLSGHGYFMAYLARVGKAVNSACIYGDSSHDDAEHTFFECGRWDLRRFRLMMEVGHISPDNIIGLMTSAKTVWARVSSFIEDILRTKKADLDQALLGAR